jgi:outer membrane receptor protein involved in Fe transport
MKKYIFIATLTAISSIVCAQIKDSVMLDDLIISAPKEQMILREQPLASYKINNQSIEKEHIYSLKDISALVPNFYIPDYGSKITSSIYVRGISSRMNEPSVGLYVDDIPYLDKSSFDFDFYDISSVTLLQGPQGTLYGRNSMGGLIKINTLSPLDFQGTKLSLSYGNYNDIKANVAHYQKLTNKLGLSVAGYYNSNDGYFTNIYDDEKNSSQDFGGRAKLDWRLSEKWKANLNLSVDHTSQDAYPYKNLSTGNIDYNEDGSYWRNMATAGLSLQRSGKNVLFTSSSSFQYLNDEMNIDQDFTATPIFALSQNQKEQIATQEFVFRSKNSRAYQWVTGAFGFYKNVDTNAPMTMRSGGISMIQQKIDEAMAIARQYAPRTPFITITNDELIISGDFKTPSYGAALYHQSTYNFTKNFSATAGLRLDYETSKIDYSSEGTLNTLMNNSRAIDSTYSFSGNLSKNYWQLLPKIALKYEFNNRSNIYASVTKGYKAGGYNYSMFSDVVSSSMQNKSIENVENQISYDPEYSWNYEIGVHTQFFDNRLFADAAIFYITDHNQQMVTTADNGSRMITNADEVESYGAEVSLLAKITKQFSVNTAYGYTHSTFKKYIDEATNTDYSGNYVPFAPQNTLSVGATYNLIINKKFLDKISISAQYTGVGKIYWNEENTVSQDFYGTLNGEVSFVKKSLELSVWSKNILDKEYDTFYFESLGNSFVQQGKPFTFGVMAKFSF